MIALYNIALTLLRFLYFIASWFNPKAAAFRKGRRDQATKLASTFPLAANEKLVWIHCASLGEFEQGRPVIEGIKTWNRQVKILLTFFSPSGYEVRKDYEHADYIFYLPWDNQKNAHWFAEYVNPSLVIFVKYEFWYHYTHELSQKHIPIISISSIFRKDQSFFKSYGSLFRSVLQNFNHFFVQNEQSVSLLQSIGIKNITLSGDTRFDRVHEIMQRAEQIPIAEQFKDGQKLMVIGSAWPDDTDVLFPFINGNLGRLKFIIAPHEITESFIKSIEESIAGKSVRYSNAHTQSLQDASVLIIDNIGLLSRLYRYGEFAFVGGAFGDGLHNILEPACYGVPIFFGNRYYQKFQEAVDLVFRGGAFEVKDFMDLKTKYELLMNHPETYLLACDVTLHYVQENLGASKKIVDYSKKFLV